MVQAAAGKGGRGGGEEVEDEGGRGHWCRPWVDPGTRVSPMVMDCVVDLLISKPPPCLSGECWRQTATFLARKMLVVVTRHRRVEVMTSLGDDIKMVMMTSLVPICSCPLERRVEEKLKERKRSYCWWAVIVPLLTH